MVKKKATKQQKSILNFHGKEVRVINGFNSFGGDLMVKVIGRDISSQNILFWELNISCKKEAKRALKNLFGKDMTWKAANRIHREAQKIAIQNSKN
jgi:hypothetical protein